MLLLLLRRCPCWLLALISSSVGPRSVHQLPREQPRALFHLTRTLGHRPGGASLGLCRREDIVRHRAVWNRRVHRAGRRSVQRWLAVKRHIAPQHLATPTLAVPLACAKRFTSLGLRPCPRARRPFPRPDGCRAAAWRACYA